MAQQQHLPNGVPPQLFGANAKPSPQFNGIGSAHSSRDSSPSARLAGQIPASQLPPGRLPQQIGRASPIVQKMGQLTVGAGPSPKFSTSTPNQSLHSAGLVGSSAFSPIIPPGSSTQLQQQPKVEQQQQQQQKVSAAASNQFETIPLTPTSLPNAPGQGDGRPAQGAPQTQSSLNNHFRQANNVPQQQPPPNHNNHRQEVTPLAGQNQGRPPQIQPQFVGRGQQQPQPPPQQPFTNTPPVITTKQAAPAAAGAPLSAVSHAAAATPHSHPHPSPGRMPTSASQPQLSQYQHQNASPVPPFQTQSQSSSPFLHHQHHQQPQQQPQPQFSSQGSAGGTLTLNRPPPQLPLQPPQLSAQLPRPPQLPQQPQQQFKTNVHTNRYPQGGPVPGSLPTPLQQPQSFQQLQQQPLAQQLQQPGFNQPNIQQQQQYPQQQPSFQQQQRQPQVPPQGFQQLPPSHQFQQQPQTGYTQPQQQNSVTHSGFNRLWGQDSFDLLQNPNVLPPEKVAPPKIHLGQESLDAANCSPEVFRCTMTKIPESSSLLQKSRLPLGVLIHPFKDMTYLTVIQSETIVRCRACRTYINPFVFFVDSKRWKCNLCYRVNELPEEFMYDPISRTYGDPSRRPEIKMATVEYIAPAEYMLRPPQPAMYLFLFDVSRLAVESGYLQSVCAVLLEQLKNLPGDARTQIGIVAYDSALHFYSMGEGLSQPHEMTILDIDDVFLPCPDNLLVNLKDRADLLTDLLTQLPVRFNQTYDNSSALGAALQVAHKMMGATGGRVTVFQASLPNVGPGALQPREDPSQRASSEVPHLNPANDFYKRLALECSAQQIAVDLFVLNSQYVDIATLSGISRFSGGCIHHYPLFSAGKVLANERFERELRRYLTRKIGFEAVMRIRCTRGLSIHTFHGNFFVRSTDLLSLPNVNPDAGFGMQVSIDENLSDIQSVCFQAALLYTSSRGERRIRVHTICLPICATLADVINSADQQCIVGLLAKMAVDRSMLSSLSDAREAFINVAIDTLSSYKLALNLGSAQSGLLAPQCLRLLPLYISALLKHISFRIGTSTRLDDRVKAMIDMKTKPLFQLIQMIYPDLYPVHNLEEQKIIINSQDEQVHLPPLMQLTARCLDSKGAFLMDAGEHMILLVSPGVPQVFLNEALGVRDYISIGDEMYELPVLDNPHNQRLHQFISHLNDDKPFPATLHVVRDNSPHRVQFFERLIEDRVENALSYHEFLQHLKTQVK